MSRPSATSCRSCTCMWSGASAPIRPGRDRSGDTVLARPIRRMPRRRWSSGRPLCSRRREARMSEGLGFIGNPLVRHSAERDAGLVARHAADPKALTVVIAGDVPILRRNGTLATGLLRVQDADRAACREQVFLGTLADAPVLATLLDAAAAELLKDDGAFEVLDLRAIAVQ